MAAVRYLVPDVGSAVDFYLKQLGFELVQRYGPAMAIVERGDLQLWLAGPSASASQPMPDGRRPVPGGWNRLVLDVDDLDAVIDRLRAAGVAFRNNPVVGPGGRQVLVEDPAGNPIELYQAH